ncbi:MAG: hypothetical protein Q7R81_03915 [Candidatus Peregrinibacteria bacterium]|nr:hypothetical protein [Candidatus Peregrinibacteria bacterium]
MPTPLGTSRASLKDWLFALASLAFTAGLFVDGWAHNHLPSALETFFTPWHALFYAGFFLCAGVPLLWTLHRRKHVQSWQEAVPPGYGYSLLGAAVFAIGGISDMAWHTLFGVEADIEALLSPTHLLLATGMTLLVSGGMRATWEGRKLRPSEGLLSSLPFLLSVACTMGAMLFMTQFGHYTDLEAGPLPPTDPELASHIQALSVLGILLFSVIITGTFAVALRRGFLPFGGITVVLGLVIAGLSFMRSGRELILPAITAGLMSDLFLLTVRDSLHPVARLRVFCFLLPAVYQALAMLVVIQTHGLWWSVHMWTGVIVLAGMAGLLTSVIAWPGSAYRPEVR